MIALNIIDLLIDLFLIKWMVHYLFLHILTLLYNSNNCVFYLN